MPNTTPPPVDILKTTIESLQKELNRAELIHQQQEAQHLAKSAQLEAENAFLRQKFDDAVKEASKWEEMLKQFQTEHHDDLNSLRVECKEDLDSTMRGLRRDYEGLKALTRRKDELWRLVQGKELEILVLRERFGEE